MSRGKDLSHDHGLFNNEMESDPPEPEEINEQKLKKGISFFNLNFFSMFVSMLTGLLSLMFIQTIASVLDATKKSNSGIRSFQRYLSTINHTVQWYSDLPSLLKSSSKVRGLHKQAASLQNFTQYEMVVTQWAFVGPVLLWPDQLGVDRKSEDDIEGVIYVMMMVGRQLGISDQFNLCRGDREQCTEYSRLILEKIIKPSFNSPEASEVSKRLGQDLLEGVNILNPFISPRSFLLWSEDLIRERKSPEVPHQFGYGEHFLYRMQTTLLSGMFASSVVGGLTRGLANNLMRLNIFLATEWRQFIVSQALGNKDKIDFGLGAAQAFLIIPVLVVISTANVLYRSLLKFRSEIALTVMLATAIVILIKHK